jgi:hypothetical protein
MQDLQVQDQQGKDEEMKKHPAPQLIHNGNRFNGCDRELTGEGVDGALIAGDHLNMAGTIEPENAIIDPQGNETLSRKSNTTAKTRRSAKGRKEK